MSGPGGVGSAAATVLAWAPALALALIVVAAAWVDARERRLPNGLAAAAVVTGAMVAVWPAVMAALGGGSGADLLPNALGLLASHAVPALLTAAALVALEVGWRRLRGSAGLGMGDVKLLFALMLADPLRGLTAFCVALLLLAAACLVTRRASLPLIPFIALAGIPLLGAAL
ncbi:prepilin peptidase [Collinsella vaginalis]|uniref:prepilin peptidase n=1 Tax=Collinsella vaginalis TaxID=1870987 RepID=UPI0015C513CA|nr:prepilin peptidase [Collinsella vaginalis]